MHELQTFTEAGVPGYHVDGWSVCSPWAARRHAPRVVEHVYTEVAEVLRMPEVKEYVGMGSLNLA